MQPIDQRILSRKSRADILGLVALVIVCFLAWGCGRSQPEPVAPSTEARPAPALAAVDSLANTLTPSAPTSVPAFAAGGIHSRIMTEQAARAAAAARMPLLLDVSSAFTLTTGPAPPSPASTPPTSTPLMSAAGAAASTSTVFSGGQTPIRGIWSGDADRLASFLLDVNPSPRFTVTVRVLAGYYVRYCAQAGLRADLLWAQMIRETGYGKYDGDVPATSNNFAGIGATGGGAPGADFPTAEAGVMAHVAHMIAYVYASSPVAWANARTDPRFDAVSPRGMVSVLSDLDGRWAVPGLGYGEGIEALAKAINGR